jgi:cell division protein FtsN
MTTTKSRATRAADKAEADAVLARNRELADRLAEEDQDQQPEQEEQEQEQEQPEEEQEQEEQPEPEPTPTAAYDLGEGRIRFYRPVLTLPSGETVECPHDRWGHELEPHAMKCLRKLAAGHGVKLAK